MNTSLDTVLLYCTLVCAALMGKVPRLNGQRDGEQVVADADVGHAGELAGPRASRVHHVAGHNRVQVSVAGSHLFDSL